MTNTYFASSFETNNFNQWSYVQGQDTSQGGPGPNYVYITTPEKAGIVSNGSTNIAHFQPISTGIHAKVYKEWTTEGKKDQFGRTEDAIWNNENVSGIYKAFYYFPKNYTAGTRWPDIFFFKEEGIPNAGGTIVEQNPSWWLNVAPANTFDATLETVPVLFANNWGTDYSNFHPKTVKLPLGQWVEIKAELHEFTKNNSANRIDWYLNGVRFDTSRGSTYPIGTFYHKTNEWIFGVGHYEGAGELFVDKVSVTSLT